MQRGAKDCQSLLNHCVFITKRRNSLEKDKQNDTLDNQLKSAKHLIRNSTGNGIHQKTKNSIKLN